MSDTIKMTGNTDKTTGTQKFYDFLVGRGFIKCLDFRVSLWHKHFVIINFFLFFACICTQFFYVHRF